jgi:hypothetical protein
MSLRSEKINLELKKRREPTSDQLAVLISEHAKNSNPSDRELRLLARSTDLNSNYVKVKKELISFK